MSKSEAKSVAEIKFAAPNLTAYIHRALNRSGRKIDRKVCGSRQSLLEDIFAGLRIYLGPDYLDRLEAKLKTSEFKDSEEQKALIEIINSIAAEPRREEATTSVDDIEVAEPDDVGIFADLTLSLRSAMDELPADDQALLWDRVVGEMGFRQLAKKYGIPKSTLSDRVERLLKQLLDRLTQEINNPK